MRAAGPPKRALLGFVAGALSVLIFHQGTWALLYALDLMPPPYPMDPVPPWGVPLTIDFCFWAGLYGAALGLIWPRLTIPPWFAGMGVGVIAILYSGSSSHPSSGSRSPMAGCRVTCSSSRRSSWRGGSVSASYCKCCCRAHRGAPQSERQPWSSFQIVPAITAQARPLMTTPSAIPRAGPSASTEGNTMALFA